MMLCEGAFWAFLGALYLIYLYLVWNYDYWKNKGVAHVEGKVPFGNIRDIIFNRRTMAQVYEEIYKKFPDKKMVGFFKMRKPILMVRDPELVREVLVSQFSSFRDNDFIFSFEANPILALNPFSISGERWKEVRGIFKHPQSPMKLKAMLPYARTVAYDLTKYINRNLMTPLEGKNLAGNFTADLVASCIFGIQAQSFEEVDNEFRYNAGRVLNGEFWANVAVLLSFYAPEVGKLFKCRIIQKEVHDFFTRIVTDTVKYRLKEGIVRHDFLQNMINDNLEAQKKGQEPVHSYDEITAHCMTFFLDGYNTSSIAIGFILHELAMNKDCQDKCRAEILKSAKTLEELEYENIIKLEYTNGVILESLRLHPPVPVMTKRCTKDTMLQCGNEACTIEKGTGVTIPVLSLHTDPLYFPDPFKFDPERHTKEGKETRPHYAFLPFGEGPRICLGVKFSQLVVTMALAAVLMNFEILPKDPSAQIEQDPSSSFLYLAKGGVWIKFRRLST